MSASEAGGGIRVLKRRRRDWGSILGTALSGGSAALILAILAVILIDVVIHGAGQLSWRFVSSIPGKDFFSPDHAAVLPMIVGTVVRVVVMAIFSIPVGVVTAVYLTEYGHPDSVLSRATRVAVANIAGIPSIVFGLFGLGFFINFLGRNIDGMTGATSPRWGQPGLLWASLTLGVMTLPVVIVATEEALRSIPPGLREASLALGATKLQTIVKVVLPNALPGILTGAILAVSRAAGEVAPILLTGAAFFMASLPRSLSDQFMDLGYHTYVLATQSPNVEKTKPVLYGTVLALLLVTFTLNMAATIARARARRRRGAGH
jgi:phosphate transport system permease protein